jgi:4-hydroxythreonine-4-phosphate dehydrogenase
MIPPRIAILADDLTGAADTAAGMLAAGRPWVTWRRPNGTLAWHDDDRIVAIDAETRQASAADAGKRVRDLAALCRTAGFAHIYKKIDSTLRGHIGVEVKAALDGWGHRSLAIVAPAFPAMRRTMVDGRQRVGDVPLDCPLLAETLTSASVPVTMASLADVRGGVLDRLFEARAGAGSGAVVCDAVTEADLAAIAAAGATLEERVVWVGSGGLARTIFNDAERTPPQLRISDATRARPVLVVSGSLAGANAVQLARVAAEGAVRVIVPIEELSGRGSALECIREVEHQLRTGADVVVTIGGQPPTTTVAEAMLVDRLGRMLHPCSSLIGGVVATGGETAAALLRQWDISGVRLVGEVEPGVPIGLATGPRPLIVALKAGSFGSVGTLAAARAAVRSLVRCSLAQ